MKKLGMRWAFRCRVEALTVTLLTSAVGCHLSRADAWDNKHKRVPATVVEAQLSSLRVAAGQPVIVRCAASKGSAPLADVATHLQISPQQAWQVTEDAADPHARTLVPTIQGTYRLTCAVPEASSDAQSVEHSVTLRVHSAEAVRWKAKVPATAVAGARVPVKCIPVDAFGNIVSALADASAAAGTAPGFSITPDVRVQTDALSFTAKPAGTYTVVCHPQGTLAASDPSEGQVEVQPEAPHVWWSVKDDAPLTDPRAAHCVSGDASITPPYGLRDRYNNLIPTSWRIQRVQADGHVEPASIADTDAPGVYRFTPVIHEFTDAARLSQASFDMMRDPPPPSVIFDDIFRAHGWHVCNASEVHLATGVSAACGVRSVRLNNAPQTLREGARDVSMAHRIGVGQWGMQHLVVDAANHCGSTTRRVASYIASPRFERPDAEHPTPALAWRWGEKTWRNLLQQAWRQANTAAPAQMAAVDGRYAIPQGSSFLRRMVDPRVTARAAMNWWYSEQAASGALRVHHAGPIASDDFRIDAVTVDAAGNIAVKATWTNVVVPGTAELSPNEASAVALHLPQVQANITAGVVGDRVGDPEIVLDLGEPSAAKLIAAAVQDANLPTPHALSAELVMALDAAWTPAVSQALQYLSTDSVMPPPYELAASPSARKIVAEAGISQQFADGAWVQEARPKYTSVAWQADRRPGAAAHPVGAQPAVGLAQGGTDSLRYSDDGINALLWSVWAADGFAAQDLPGPLKEVALALPVVWMPSNLAGDATLGVASRIQVQAEEGEHTYEGDMQGQVPVRVIWREGHLQVQPHPTLRPTWGITADHPADAQKFEAAAGAAGLDAWLLVAVNQVLQGLPKPELLRSMPQPCQWQPSEVRRAPAAIWTEIVGQAICPAQ